MPLKEGDWLVQNGANSAVGLAVIQLAKVKHQLRKDRSTPPVDLKINIFEELLICPVPVYPDPRFLESKFRIADPYS